MNGNIEKQLEALIDRELKQLPALPAPPTLLPRVLAALGHRAALPWYRSDWQAWPFRLQVASLACLAAMFAGLCFGSWQLSEAAMVGEATQTLRHWFSGFAFVWSTLAVLGNALVLAAKNLGPLAVWACIIAGLATYLSCLGLGTAFVRLAVVRRH